MEDELLAACRRVLQQGLPGDVPAELDDEHRFIPVAVDVNGDVAATVFLRWLAPGRAGLEKSVFERRDGAWAYLGGGVGDFEDYPLAEPLTAAGAGGALRAISYGQSHLRRPPRFPWGARYAFHAALRASAEVRRLQAGGRVIDVPFHGYAVLVWPGRRGPAVTGLARDGSRQASMDLSRDPFGAGQPRFPMG